MTYKDMTFCPGDGCAKFNECPRALTQEVKEKSGKAGLLVSQFMEPKKQECYEEPKKEEEA